MSSLGFCTATRLAVIEAEGQWITPPQQRQQKNNGRMFQSQRSVAKAMRNIDININLAGTHRLHHEVAWVTCKRFHKRAREN